MSGMFDQDVGVDVCANFGDSRSSRSRDIGAYDCLTLYEQRQRRRRAGHHIWAKRGVLPKKVKVVA